MLRLLPLLGGSRVNLLGSVSACGCERQKEFVVERSPMKQKEGRDEADAEQEDLALWDRGKNKQKKARSWC